MCAIALHGQKRAPDILELKLMCSCELGAWGPNLGLLEEESMLSLPSISPHIPQYSRTGVGWGGGLSYLLHC